MTPLDGAFTKPVCNEMLTDMLVAKGVEVVPNAPLAAVTDKAVVCPDGKTVPYDLLVTIPPHEGSDLIDEAGLGDGLGFGLTDKQTLKSKKAERVFLLGDNTNVPTSKAGSVAHFQAEVVVHNLLREIAGKESEPLADGHANCFIETGFGKAILVDFNYDIQPVPGKFPLPVDRPDDAAGGNTAEPPRQARLQADLLARAAARPPDPAGGFADEHARQAHARAGTARALVGAESRDARQPTRRTALTEPPAAPGNRRGPRSSSRCCRKPAA